MESETGNRETIKKEQHNQII